MRRRRECGSSPPLSALAGLTVEARSAGAKPNRSVTPKASAMANPMPRQSAGSDRRSGLSGELILPTTNGADHHANNAPMAAARNASIGLSISTSCTSRPRGGLSRHQVGDVSAGDQQHQRHQYTQSRERTAVIFLHIGDAGGGGLEQQRLFEECIHLPFGHSGEAFRD